jgi:hypothetical protein
MGFTEADEFVKACRLGQTEYGSFVAKITCPLDAGSLSNNLFDNYNPFARKTTVNLITACNKIVENIEQDSVDKFLESNMKQPLISSNLCDALLKMQSIRDKGSLFINVNWATDMAVPFPANIVNKVTFKAEYFRIIENIQQALKPKIETENAQFLIGTVETLNGNVGDDGRRSGEVILALLLPDEGVLRARLNLEANNYSVAVEAHKKGQGYVSFHGVLHRGPRIGRVENISVFKLMDDK